MEKFAQVLSAAENSANGSNLPDWYALAKKLPKSLQKVLVSEIGFGNTVIGIGSSNWPNVGSIVVNIANRFNSVSRTISPDVHWRNLDDPHYCREEISQKDLGVEHLIIT
jgi:hypothetical protein